ncbi:hypothetical protein MSPP1_003279 [Malassezia sp. CBS 17886]|nr:hypothetical protein MSPP1_003279 [Malassezia sp. CBS 17886]
MPPLQGRLRRAHGLPVLPREVLAHVVACLAAPARDGDAAAVHTLVHLAAVSHLVRAWALDALYAVLVLPRHVRGFRRWYARMRSADPPFPCVGHVRALFMAVDDITRLTSVSAGWEAEMLRLLHYCGSSITFLSLWQTESRALLRDAAQQRGRREGLQPAWAVGEGFLLNGDGAATPCAPRSPDEDMPRWLRAELEATPASDVARSHLAHFPLVPRTPTAERWRSRPRPRACTPRFLSLVLSYPLFENERPDMFANMLIWSCVEDLDVYVPAEMRKSLFLLSQLVRTPTRRLRVSSAHCSLAIDVVGRAGEGEEGGVGLGNGAPLPSPPSSPLSNSPSPPAPSASSPPPNACALLRALLESQPLEQALLNAFGGNPSSDAATLAAACRRHLITSRMVSWRNAPRLHVTQGNQALWGKLKQRLWDFRERAEFGRAGAWGVLLRDE